MSDTATSSAFLDALRSHVLIGDGAMGTQLQAFDLDVEDDFLGLEGCNEILNHTRPDVLRQIHRAYFEAGADLVETNTFGCNLPNLADYDIADRCRELAYKGTAVAREVADEMGPGRNGMRRFVVGSLGPGTKLPSLGHAPYGDLRGHYKEAALGIIEGGGDAFLIETAQDLLQVKAAVHGVQDAMTELGVTLPIICHVTVETTGTMLMGSEIGAALTALEPLGIDMIGLNCATGPAEMSEHLRYLSKHASIPVSVMPNAGLPVLGKNGAEYPLTAEELAEALRGFVTDYGLSMVGGCCGTTPEHIRAVRDAVVGVPEGETSALESVPVGPVERAEREIEVEDAVASLYTSVPLSQGTGITMIGERTNANGSRAFREAMLAGDWEKCVDIAKQQTRDGAHMLDLCVDYVGRDGREDMATLASLLATSSTLPIMLDSTEPEVIRVGLEHLGGRSIVNSVNFEDGDGPESRYRRIMAMVQQHGAAVVALTIDEEGQARTAEHKIRIAERLIEDITGTYGLKESDIIVDCLTFPISTGQEETRRDGIETIEAIRELKKRHPEVHTTLGLSNISFGLNPAARQVLNSVFLHECIQVGLDSAIAHSSKILPMNRIDERQREVALDMVYDRRAEGYDPLQEFMQLFEGVSAADAKDARAEALAAMPLFERLAQRIIDGDKNGLEEDLEAGMKEKKPIEIINEDLLNGMKTVGELFGSGQMQLPFVLQSAETMKTAVAYLEPFMEDEAEATGEARAESKGRIVLATVKGDVHDIGKNLVDIIMSNNGYDVVNLGIKQPISAMLEAAEKHNADAIGMSGLLVKSTVVMKDNLEEMNAAKASHYPVMLGGAALTRTYVENDLAEVYQGDVYYARDAFEGLSLMDELMAEQRGEGADPDSPEAIEAARKKEERRARNERSKRIAAERKAKAEPVEVPERSDVATDTPVATPPFWGTRIVKGLALAEYLPTLDERALFMGQWGLKATRGGEGPSYEELVETEGRPRFRYWIDRLKAEGILDHTAIVYGYFPAVSEGDDVVILESPEPDAPERMRFSFPRQQRGRFLCIADFIRPREQAIAEGQVDVFPFQLVTMGDPIAQFANKLFAANEYRDYLEVHGLGVQLTEAIAEYWHARIRSELQLTTGGTAADDDAEDKKKFFDLDYRGARFSFGYGSCPDLEDRIKMVELLQPERIGVELSEELQLHPEQSTDAFVLYHPEAKYFNV
ncbi:5-methyltetrahydrofolate--homocysteine methyltransferase [Corynebacterium efficiens YS-314]|uniref:Methionine synthase n=1 Tax=Corynebacterium efficiens (strain DSM 44549 / YS-314 / AJ 12310 / JCM 11189 / NBRC 100395) TaxID=196164 RepID=Q8FTD2_COREF|nr:methionine synthase [Corynebacterium efficiens]EEW49748.1 5-methyltetrahydrofolate--homocysteine methyltransferase [Corynebacterium efficiens YS-314]BAC18447.1 putative 5-methyltetrahydrofolate--homocysteine methyltransferase [Corynebacterium efficiens YS-314]